MDEKLPGTGSMLRIPLKTEFSEPMEVVSESPWSQSTSFQIITIFSNIVTNLRVCKMNNGNRIKTELSRSRAKFYLICVQRPTMS